MSGAIVVSIPLETLAGYEHRCGLGILGISIAVSGSLGASQFSATRKLRYRALSRRRRNVSSASGTSASSGNGKTELMLISQST